MTITLNGTTGITTPDVTSNGLTVDSTTLVVDEANNRVGVGTSSPSRPAHVYSGTSTNTPLRIQSGVATGAYATFGDTNTTGELNVRVGAKGNELHITTGGVDSRVVVDSSGNLLVGTTSGIYNFTLQSSSSRSLFAQAILASDATSGTHYMIGFKKSDGGTVGSITHNNTTTSYNTSSDYRLKEDWVPVVNASTRVTALKPVNFAWKADGKRVDGFLAHELAEVVPEAVTGEKDAVELVDIKDEDGNVTGQEERPVYQGIDQSKLVPLLTAALQEALAKIDDLTARVSALEATNV